jgi:hypothetical protein
MSKLSKFSKPKKVKPEKIVKEKEKKNYGISKSVKAKSLNVSSHVVVPDTVIRNRLIVVAAILFFAVSVFSVVFSIIRTENMKKSIAESQKRIETLNYMNSNIDYYNELFAYDKLFNKKDNIFSKVGINVPYIISTIWDYQITVSVEDGQAEIITTENLEKLSNFEEGKEYTIIIKEYMTKSINLPESVLLNGSINQGDQSDDLDGHVWLREFSEEQSKYVLFTGAKKKFTIIRDYPNENNVSALQITKELTYTFTGHQDIQLYYSMIFADLLGFPHI